MNNPEQNITGSINLPNFGFVSGVEGEVHRPPGSAPKSEPSPKPSPPTPAEPPVDTAPRWRGTVSVGGFEMNDLV